MRTIIYKYSDDEKNCSLIIQNQEDMDMAFEIAGFLSSKAVEKINMGMTELAERYLHLSNEIKSELSKIILQEKQEELEELEQEGLI